MSTINRPLRLSDALTRKTVVGVLVRASAISVVVALLAASGFFYIQAKHETDLLLVVQDNITSLLQNDDLQEAERVLGSFLAAAPASNIFVVDANGIVVSLPYKTKVGEKLVVNGINMTPTVTIGSDNKIWAKIDLVDHYSRRNFGSLAMSMPLTPLINKAWLILLGTFSLLFLSFLSWTRLSKRAVNQALLPLTRLYKDLLLIGSGNKPKTHPTEFEITELAEMSDSILKTYKDVCYLTEEAAKKEGERRAKESMRSLLHDLANPLQAQSNLISTFCAYPNDEKLKLAIIEQWPSLEEQIQHLMSTSRHLEIENPHLTLSDIIKTVETGARNGAALKPAALKLKLSDNSQSSHVKHDPDLISRAIANLVRNSVEEGATNVEVWCDPKDLRIHVKDDGPGIPKDKLTLLFENRLKSSKPGGTGVGFPTALRLVKAHRGKILFNETEIGAHFIIDLSNLRSAV